MERRSPTHVLIAGGGVAALEAALALRALADELVEVELLAPETLFWYRPLAVAEPFELGEARHFELSELAAAAGATLTYGALAAVDSDRHLAHTFAHADVPYDLLLIACGAVPVVAVTGALTFRGSSDTAEMERLLAELKAGGVTRVAFAVPPGTVWSLPAYELALLTAEWAAAHDIHELELTIVTPEEGPLRIFGPDASAAIADLLETRGIRLRTGASPVDFRDGELHVLGGDSLAADRVVALPRLRGRRIDGIPQTSDGFTPVDLHGRVFGVPYVYAAGDATSFPLKQGGIAAQQAEAAAESIAAAAGANLRPTPFTPVLRGLLLTGREPLYLRRETTRTPGEAVIGAEPLWWPPAKIVGRHLAPFLGVLAGIEIPRELEAGPGAVPVHVELDVAGPKGGEALLRAAGVYAFDDDSDPIAADVMDVDFVIVGGGDTLADAAARLRERDREAALVVDEERLVGILTARDLLRAVAARVDTGNVRVRQFMTAEPLTVSRGTAIGAAVFLMTEYGVHHLPVVEDERPVGVLALGEATRAARSGHGMGLGF